MALNISTSQSFLATRFWLLPSDGSSSSPSCPGPWNPALAAKQLATLDQLAGGRVAVNIVSGWFRGEFHAIGEPYRSSYNLTLLIRSALPITDTELNDIAAPAMTGLSKTPNNG